jgi:S-formylglutathione hydrolase FrmB
MTSDWIQETIAEHAVDIYVPSEVGRPGYALLFLHGVGQETLVGCDAFTRVFDQLGVPCISPIGKWSWWSDRLDATFDPKLSAEQHLLQNVLPFVRERFRLQDRRVGLFGISMGGQGALRLGFKYPQVFPVVAGISPAIEYQEYHGQGLTLDAMYASKEHCRQDTAPMHIHPNDYPPHIFFCIDPNDAEWYRGNDRLHEKLQALGIAHECDLTTEAGGHSWQYFNHMAERTVRFVYDGLVAESRRLL